MVCDSTSPLWPCPQGLLGIGRTGIPTKGHGQRMSQKKSNPLSTPKGAESQDVVACRC